MDFVCCICDKIVELFGAIWSILTDNNMKVIELGLTACGCYIAYKALSTWREQVIEQPKIELAREVVESFYNMQNLIRRARSSFVRFNQTEIEEYFKQSNLNHYQASCLYIVYQFEKNEDEILKFQKLKSKAKVFYSVEIENSFNFIIQTINHIQTSCIELSKDAGKNDWEKHLSNETIQKYEAVIWNQGNDDSINIQIEKIIKEVEYNLKPIYETKAIKWKKLNQEPKEQENDK